MNSGQQPEVSGQVGTDPGALSQALSAHVDQFGRDRLLNDIFEALPKVVAQASDPLQFALGLRRIATEMIATRQCMTEPPHVSELVENCRLWMAEPKRLLDEACKSELPSFSQSDRQLLYEGLLRRIKGRHGYISVWPKFPLRARTRKDRKLDATFCGAVTAGRMTQAGCREILWMLYGREHVTLFDPIFEMIERVRGGLRPRPDDFPPVDIGIG